MFLDSELNRNNRFSFSDSIAFEFGYPCCMMQLLSQNQIFGRHYLKTCTAWVDFSNDNVRLCHH